MVLICFSSSAEVRYVDHTSATPVWPYTNWSTAASVLQDAVDAALPGDLVLVTNGVYDRGSILVKGTVLSNRVAALKPVRIESVNGPRVTIIQGINGYSYASTTNMRCVYLGSGASLAGFTLTNGATFYTPTIYPDLVGAGAYCESTSEVLSNCVIAGNYTFNSIAGVYQGTLIDCILTNNSASQEIGGAYGSTLERCWLTGNYGAAGGGGAAFCTLNNCVLVGNSVGPRYTSGGGASSSLLNNCIVVSNGMMATTGAGTLRCTNNNSIVYYNGGSASVNWSGGSFNYCCVAPLPAGGAGNFSAVPLFVDPGHNNFRLQPNSPCINSGNNVYVGSVSDLGGNPRILGGTVDVGAYEFQNPSSVISYAWLQQYGLPMDGSADFIDSDADGMNNWQEWRCGTNPTNALSVLRLLTPLVSGGDIVLRWQSVGGRTYFVEGASDVAGSAGFVTLATNIAGLSGITSYTNVGGVGAGPMFYRVGVH